MSVDRDPESLGERITKAIPEAVTYLGIGALLLDDALHGVLNTPTLIPTDIRISLIGAVLASLVWSLAQHARKLSATLDTLGQWRNSSLRVVSTWDELDLLKRYRAARQVRILTLAGTQFAKLGLQEALQALFDLSKDKDVRILIGNPKADGIKLRYTPGQGEPATFETGPDGVERRLKDLHARWVLLSAQQQKQMQIRVFAQYPTLSIVQMDDDWYSASYGFELRGGDCPKLHSQSGGEYAHFLRQHFDKTFDKAEPLDEWMRRYHPSAALASPTVPASTQVPTTATATGHGKP
jgi:hypothetical protein